MVYSNNTDTYLFNRNGSIIVYFFVYIELAVDAGPVDAAELVVIIGIKTDDSNTTGTLGDFELHVSTVTVISTTPVATPPIG